MAPPTPAKAGKQTTLFSMWKAKPAPGPAPAAPRVSASAPATAAAAPAASSSSKSPPTDKGAMRPPPAQTPLRKSRPATVAAPPADTQTPPPTVRRPGQAAASRGAKRVLVASDDEEQDADQEDEAETRASASRPTAKKAAKVVRPAAVSASASGEPTPPASSPLVPDAAQDSESSASRQPTAAASSSRAARSVQASDDEDEAVVPLRRRATLKRPAYFESDAESASAATAESDSDDAFAPVSASKANGRGKAGPAAKKARGRADDDWLVDDDDSESAALTDASAMDVDTEAEAGPSRAAPKKKAPARRVVEDTDGEGASGSRLASFKMGAAPAGRSSGSPPSRDVPASKPRTQSLAHLTKAERRAVEERQKKTANEVAYSFLQDLRDKDGNRPGEPEYDPRTLYVPKSAWKGFTPFEVQFWEIKQKHWDTVLFFQKGKFYELYEEDALIGHREFDLKLTDRVKMKMVGVPESSFEMFANKFLALGYKVGRVDQCETAVAKGMRVGEKTRGGGSEIVRRELRHVLTGGTIVDASCLPDDMSSYCVSIKEMFLGALNGDAGSETAAAVPTFGVCILDAATAEFRLTHFDDDASRTRLETLLRSLRIKELMHEKAGLSQRTMRVLRNTVPLSCQTTMLKAGSEFLDLHGARRKLDALFAPGEETTEASVFPAAIQKMLDKPAAMSALGGMLWYLEQLNLDADLVSSRNFDVFDPLRQDACLVLDAQSLTHLNVLSNEQGDDEGTLHRLLNRCITPFGKRLFKIWLVAPLAARAPLEARHDAVDAFLTNPTFEDEFDGFARSLPDIERIMPRIYAGKCKPADFTRTLKALTRIDPAVERLLELAHDFATPVVGDLLRSIPAVAKRSSRLQSMFTVQEDGAFSPRRNVHQDYDAADDAIAKIERDLENELAKAAKAVGLEKRQVKWKHIGTKEIYQVEVPIKTRVPNDWALMSQVKDYKRYYSPAVRDLVQQLKEARETRLAALKEFHAQLFVEFSDDGPLFLRAVKGLAELDCLLSLAKASYAMGEPTCRPEFVDCETALVDFEELRHPCMATASGADFIANNVALGGEHDEVVILTGGNMAGKSTTARTTATAVILAQMGCRVPATRARISPVDRIASRMGANDQIFRNNSTFMVEMLEASRIIRECTPRSLVIMDELGRGTSTFDGTSIAFAVLHHLVGRTRCLSFFLTHYTSLAFDFASYPRVSNKHMQVLVDDAKREVVFTYRLVPGIAESSYGTQVAALAGVPLSICDRAQSVSKEFMLASKEHQAQRAQSRVPMSTLADFAHLFKCASAKRGPQPGAGDEEAEAAEAARTAKIVSQLEVIKAQIGTLGLQTEHDASMSNPILVPAQASQTPQTKRPAARQASYGGQAAKRQRIVSSPASAGSTTPGGRRSPRRHGISSSDVPSSPSRASARLEISSPATSVDSAARDSPPPSPSLKGRSSALSSRALQPLRPKQPEQMVLDLGQSIRTTCRECEMSYDRSDTQDAALHAKHHERMTRGVEWSNRSLLAAGTEVATKTLRAPLVKRLRGKTAEVLGDDEVHILSYSLGGTDAMVARKLAEVARNIDDALGAAPLDEVTQRSCKVLVAVSSTRGGRVLAAAVVGRTKAGAARRVLSASERDEDASASTTRLDDGGDAIFVSAPLSAEQTPPLAVHRIHVLPIARRAGLGIALLDAALSTAVYGLSAAALEQQYGHRACATAFSQPTEAGRRLAEAWIAKGASLDAAKPRLLVFGD